MTNHPEPDAIELDQALRDFRQSVHAWSEAEYSRPRTVPAEHLPSWRRSAAWALGCVLAAGSVAGGFYDYHRQAEGRLATDRTAREQQIAAQQHSAQVQQSDAKLLAGVDRDLSRAVPSAMEPLAQLMDEDSNQ